MAGANHLYVTESTNESGYVARPHAIVVAEPDQLGKQIIAVPECQAECATGGEFGGSQRHTRADYRIRALRTSGGSWRWVQTDSLPEDR